MYLPPFKYPRNFKRVGEKVARGCYLSVQAHAHTPLFHALQNREERGVGKRLSPAAVLSRVVLTSISIWCIRSPSSLRMSARSLFSSRRNASLVAMLSCRGPKNEKERDSENSIYGSAALWCAQDPSAVCGAQGAGCHLTDKERTVICWV